MPAPYDPRAVANLFLDFAEFNRLPVSNLALQKLMYFGHAKYLIERGSPLVKGYFEAWQYGPVHPLVYESFKAAGSASITFRATAKDPITRSVVHLRPIEDMEARMCASEVVGFYGKMSAGRLVDIAHATNGPWDFIVKRAGESVSLGMRIPDQVIVERFKFHKVSVTPSPRSGEPNEDAPLTRD